MIVRIGNNFGESSKPILNDVSKDDSHVYGDLCTAVVDNLSRPKEPLCIIENVGFALEV
jgi:hypothetical protein